MLSRHCVCTRAADPYAPAFEGVPLFHQSTTSFSQKQPNRSIERSVFPVIVFAHGMGGMRTVSSGICCDLASHGYVVAAIEHRYVQMTNNMLQLQGASLVILHCENSGSKDTICCCSCLLNDYCAIVNMVKLQGWFGLYYTQKGTRTQWETRR